MAQGFVHLSDIHFGQEKGGHLVVHNDVKERLVEDVCLAVKQLKAGCAKGVIISGDIAYSGKKNQYSAAGEWLDRVATAAGCKITDIQVVPGNHDIDRDEISHATNWMLEQIAAHGDAKLDTFLENTSDRELFYSRFNAYRPFAEAYDSALDKAGGGAGERTISLAPGRTLRFIGLNTALISSKIDEKGRLLLGARQRVLPRKDGEELVVIAHHPLEWLQDSEEARRYVKSRARVFISGHEHTPSVRIDRVEDGCDLMMIAAGATVPPTAEPYTYTYNILEFNWDQEKDNLAVVVYPRSWIEEKKRFDVDEKPLAGQHLPFLLGCPNFKRGAALHIKESSARREEILVTERPRSGQVQVAETLRNNDNADVPSQYPLLLLRFFRDLTASERLAVLVKLEALPKDWPEPLTHSLERRILDSIDRKGRLPELESVMNELIRK